MGYPSEFEAETTQTTCIAFVIETDVASWGK